MRKFKVKTKDKPGGKLIRGIARKVKQKPTFINLNDGEMDKRSIIIGNHSGAKGAFTYRTFMDHRFMTWGAHQMCEGYISRWRYLYHTFYRKKLSYGKIKSFLLASSFGLISRRIYGHAGIIPVYFDLRIKNTFKYSFACINKDVSVFIFPENSMEGYKEFLEELYRGFIRLSQIYYKRYGQDLPIYTLYFSAKHNTVVIGKPHYLQQLKKEMDSENQIAEFFKDYMNSLYTDYILNKTDNTQIDG